MKNKFLAFLNLLKFLFSSPNKLLLLLNRIYIRTKSKGFKWMLSFYIEKWKGLQADANSHLNWIENFEKKNQPTKEDIKNFLDRSELPFFSIYLFVNSNLRDDLEKFLNSLFQQTYPHYKIILIVDASNVDLIQRKVLNDFPSLKNIEILKKLGNQKLDDILINQSLEVSMHFITVLNEIIFFNTESLYEAARFIIEKKDIEILYSDEDKLDNRNNRVNPVFRPSWSPELLLSSHYTGHLIFYKRKLLSSVNVSELNDAVLDFDLILRASEKTNLIFHIPKILYHGRRNKNINPNVINIKKQIITSALERRGHTGTVVSISGEYPHFFDIKLQIKKNYRVSIIIPTAGKSGVVNGEKIHFLLNCLDSIQEKTTYKNLEIVVSHNGDLADDVLLKIGKMSNVLLVHYDKKKFNLSEKINLAVEASTGDYVIIFNDDIEVISADWVERLLGFAQLDGVGVVGSKLIFEDRRIQHIGIIWGIGGPGHIYYKSKEDYPGDYRINTVTHNRLGVTGACMMVKKSIYLEMGSWDVNLPLNYNDVDFCVRLFLGGYRNVICPNSVLFHYESASKEGTDLIELSQIITRYGNLKDPYFNINFYWNIDRILSTKYDMWLFNKLAVRRAKYSIKEEKIFFSIITPVFNTPAKFLKQLCRTILMQSYQNFEWVIADNGSTNLETLEVLKDFSGNKKIKVIHSNTNLGIIKGTRLAFENASGDYVLPVDHDDLIAYDALQIMASVIIQKNYPPILYSDEDKLDQNGKFISPFFKTDWDSVMFFNNCYIAHLCAFSRSIGDRLGVYTDNKAEGCHDWDTIYRFVQNNMYPLHIPEILYSWRIHSGSTATGSSEVKPYTVNSQYHVLKKQLTFMKKENEYDFVANSLIGYTGMWSIVRILEFKENLAISIEENENEEEVLKIIHIVQQDLLIKKCDIYINTKNVSKRIHERTKFFNKGEIYFLNLLKEIDRLSNYGSILFISENAILYDSVPIVESFSLLSFFNDSVLISGRIGNGATTFFADSYFHSDSTIINLGYGTNKDSAGYIANRIVQKSVDVVCPDFFAVESRFLKKVLEEKGPQIKFDTLSYTLSIIAKNQKQRAIYSPYIDLGIKRNGTKKYSTFLRNLSEEKLFNTEKNYNRYSENSNDVWIKVFEQDLY